MLGADHRFGVNEECGGLLFRQVAALMFRSGKKNELFQIRHAQAFKSLTAVGGVELPEMV